MFGKRWFGFALILATVATFVGASVRTEIQTEPVGQQIVIETPDFTTVDVDTTFYDAFAAGIDESFAQMPPDEQTLLQTVFGERWRSRVRRISLDHGWPVIRRHLHECCAEVWPHGPTDEPQDSRKFLDAMEQRRPTMQQEVEQQIRDALSRGELLSS